MNRRLRFAAVAAAFGIGLAIAGAAGFASASPGWVRVGAAGANVRTIAVDPTAPANVYAAARNDGIWLSRDGGTTWDRSNGGLDFIAAWSVSVDPSQSHVVWAATEVGGVYRSVNGGRTWRHTHGGLADSLNDYKIAIPPVPSSTELLRPLVTSPGETEGPRAGMFQDLDPDKANRGGMWGYVFDQCASDQEALRTAEKCAERADWPPGGYDFRDPDVDATTSGDQPGPPYPRTLVRYQFSSDVVAIPGGALMTAFRGSNNRLAGGFFSTGDGGQTWNMALRNAEGERLVFQQVRPGQPAANLWRVRVAPSDPKIVYLAGTGGVWRSSDAGTSWPSAPTSHGGTVPHSVDGDVSADTRALAVDPLSSDVVYAGTWGAGVRVSRDGGQSWADSSSGLPDGSGIWSLAFDPSDHKRMVAAVYWHGVYESRDAGAMWTPLNDGFDGGTRQQVYTATISQNGTMFAGTIDGIWKMSASSRAAVRGTRTARKPLAQTGLSDVALVVGGLVLLGAAVGVAVVSLRKR